MGSFYGKRENRAREDGFIKVEERNAKHTKSARLFLGVLCALRVEKIAKRGFTLAFEKIIGKEEVCSLTFVYA
jgi:hypothetical protein